jgi:hypothetical protein
MSNGILFSMAPNLALEQASASLHQRVFGLTSRTATAHVAPTNGDFRLTDWVAILKEQTATGDQMGREVPQMLANPDITEAQVKTLFSALEKQAEFVEKLRMALEKFGHDFSIIKAAERLEERYADLAASVAERLKAMRK